MAELSTILLVTDNPTLQCCGHLRLAVHGSDMEITSLLINSSRLIAWICNNTPHMCIHRCMQLHGCSVHMHTIILRHMSSEMTPSCLSEIVAILVHGVDSDILISVYSIPRYYSYCIKLKVSRANYALYMHPLWYANLLTV